MKDIVKLKAACDAIIADPKLAPICDPNTGAVIETHCNFGAMRVAHALGCDELQGLMADAMYGVMSINRSGKWFKVTGTMASSWANDGGLGFAAMTSEQLGETHGHIAALYPGPMVMSGKLGYSVPAVANVGISDKVEGENFAFPVSKGEASYFIWEG